MQTITNQLEFREIAPFFLDCVKQLGCQDSDIHKQDLDIACRCPVCGDSRTRKNLKRLHLYQKGDVINVNCFNGDCSVKNMTPYRFFQDYNARVFEQFKNFYKRKFFDHIQVERAAKDLKSSDQFNKVKEEDLFAVNPEIQDPERAVREANKSLILEMIQGFEWTLDDPKDMEAFKNLVDQVKKLGNQAFDDFKLMIS
jgi:putative DNA primase subunit|nr:MAG TPA: DNA primase [Caudoviricetes sp.]